MERDTTVRSDARQRKKKLHTFKVVLHIGHWVVILASTHGLNAGAEACDGQDNDITNFLGRLHAGKVFPCNVTLACAHIEVVGVVEVVEDGIGPDSGPGKLDDAFVVFAELAR